MGVRYSAEQRSEWVAEQAELGLRVADFCDEVGVTTNSFYRTSATAGLSSSVSDVQILHVQRVMLVPPADRVPTGAITWTCRPDHQAV